MGRTNYFQEEKMHIAAKVKPLAFGAAVVLALLFGLLLATKPAHAETFTVNTTIDAGDPTPDGTCDSDASAGVLCALREAIQEANANNNDATVTDTINFNIPDDPNVPGDEVKTILLSQPVSSASPLPPITEPVIIDGYSQPGASPNTNTDLAQGTNAVLKMQLKDGTFDGDILNGLTINASNVLVKGLVISGFDNAGIRIVGGTNNTVEGNFIGTDASGLTYAAIEDGVSISNGNGVEIDSFGTSSNNVVGGTAKEARNVISANDESGVAIGRSGNRVEGNYIGTDRTGTKPLGNRAGGVEISSKVSNPDVTDNVVGGTEAGAGNLISGNGFGVDIHNGSTDNKLEGNLIGTRSDGIKALGNFEGVRIPGGGNTTIGGTSPGAANTIAFNFRGGVTVERGTGGTFFPQGTGNSILSNSIFSNGSRFFKKAGLGLGIDLGTFNDIDGRTNNDSGDGDTGANDLQNFPVITSATSSGGSTTIQGTLNSTPNTTFTVQFFSNPKSSKDEGKIFLGEKTDVSTDANGDATFSISVPEEVKGFVTATATDSSGNTSEFSDPLKIKRVRT